MQKIFSVLMTWLHRRQVFRELRVLDSPHTGSPRDYFEERIRLAGDTLASGNRKQALAILHEMRETYAKSFATSKSALKLLLDFGAFDEIEAMMQQGRRRYPGYAHFAVELAIVAEKRGNLQEAISRCEILRREFPDVAAGYTITAACLTRFGRHQEAEAMIKLGMQKCSHDFDLLVQHARQAERREDWQEALLRWEVIDSRFNRAATALGVSRCLRRLGRYAEAEEIATATSRRYPVEPGPFVELAAIAAAKGDPEGTARGWKNVRRCSPFLALGYLEGAKAALRAERQADADAILVEGVSSLKADLGLHLEYARSAQRRGDWPAATERWALVRERFPDCEEAREQETQALAAVDASKPASADDP